MNCQRCKVEMVLGKALENIPVCGIPDFPGQTDGIGQTFTMGPDACLVPVMKCPQCGFSRTAGEV